jgi:hypothetical protein
MIVRARTHAWKSFQKSMWPKIKSEIKKLSKLMRYYPEGIGGATGTEGLQLL